ncbi:hypothetical protein HMPREF1616_03916, partial [Escherichia coli 908658]
SSTNVVSMDDDTHHPTIYPANTSMMNATIDEAPPCADVSKISHPQLVRTFSHELTVYAVTCGNGFPADGSADLFTPENTGK